MGALRVPGGPSACVAAGSRRSHCALRVEGQRRRSRGQPRGQLQTAAADRRVGLRRRKKRSRREFPAHVLLSTVQVHPGCGLLAERAASPASGRRICASLRIAPHRSASTCSEVPQRDYIPEVSCASSENIPRQASRRGEAIAFSIRTTLQSPLPCTGCLQRSGDFVLFLLR